MNEKSKKLIEEEMLNLPKEVQEAINASSWEKISQEIGKKYKLNDDEIVIFQLETASFLLGLVDEDAYPTNLETSVGLSKNEAEEIAKEALQEIFNPIFDKIAEDVKNKTKNKKLNWKQNVNFILSDGNYLTLVNERERGNNNTPQINKGGGVNKITIIRK